MKLKRIRVKNFRSLKNCEVEVGSHTAILGGNGAGKSTLLRAIERFYGSSTIVELDDFFGRRATEMIEIELTFDGFNAPERELFESRIHNDEMSVVRVFDAGGGKSNGKYYGATPQHPEFYAIRNVGGANEKRAAYNALRQGGAPFDQLPAVARADDIGPALDVWDAAHPQGCEMMRDDGQFFGFTNVFRGALQRFTGFVFIPAVRDATADSIDAKGAVIARLMELVVRSAVQRRADIREWQARIGNEYKALTDPEKLHELASLSDELSLTLRRFYGDAGVNLKWRATEEFAVPLPAADVSLDDDGFEGPVDRKGHGLQRAFILTLLQHLAKASAAAAEPALEVGPEGAAVAMDAAPAAYMLPGLILAIEEPELYQHPTKQRHFAKVLQQLSDGTLPGVAAQTQVLFASHSSLFVSVGRFDQVRLARRSLSEDGEHKECVLTSSTLEMVCRRLEACFGEPKGTQTADGLRGRLHVLGPELAEGFFAELVVLVEGASDRAALLAAGAQRGFDFEANGVAVLVAVGKTGLSKPAAIFSALGIPTYLLWDCDRGGGDAKVDQNRALQRLAGMAEADLFDYRTHVGPNFSAFEVDLETLLRSELGQVRYDAQLDVVRERYGFQGRKDVCKSPVAMADVLAGAAAEGGVSETLGQIIEAIKALRDVQRLLASPAAEGADVPALEAPVV